MKENLLLGKLGKYRGIEDMPCGVCHKLTSKHTTGKKYSHHGQQSRRCELIDFRWNSIIVNTLIILLLLLQPYYIQNLLLYLNDLSIGLNSFQSIVNHYPGHYSRCFTFGSHCYSWKWQGSAVIYVWDSKHIHLKPLQFNWHANHIPCLLPNQ